MIEEDGEIINQTESFNKETGEVTITASAHGDLEETTFIMDGGTVSRWMEKLKQNKQSTCRTMH